MESIKKVLKLIRNTINGVTKDFDPATIPWVDHTDADIEGHLKNFKTAENYPYNLVEKLRFWQKNGYVILEKAILESEIDALLKDYNYFLENNHKFDKDVLVEIEGWNKNPNQKAKDISSDILAGRGIKVNDFYNLSENGKKVMLHQNVMPFLEAILDDKVVGMQSLNFNYGSQQPAHMDFPYVVSGIPSHLAAAWIALEDIHADSGPLFYYVGSHKMPKFNWGNGILYSMRESFKSPIQFSNWLEKKCSQLGFKKEVLLIKKGDVLIWHAALVHGGTQINDLNRTRKSFVCHYSSKTAYPTHRHNPNEKPIEFELNNALCYGHPTMQYEENYFKETN